MTPRKKASPRAWQRMLSGSRLDLLNPSPLDIELEDIAHGLARVARWNGQTTGDHAFSVAQHSLLVEQIASELREGLPDRWKLAALVHDAPEYVVGDLITPFKSAIGLDYRELEDRLLQSGPPIGMTDYQDGVPVRGDYRFQADTWYSIELSATLAVPEWGGQEVRFALEEDAVLLPDGWHWADGRQDGWYVIR